MLFGAMKLERNCGWWWNCLNHSCKCPQEELALWQNQLDRPTAPRLRQSLPGFIAFLNMATCPPPQTGHKGKGCFWCRSYCCMPHLWLLPKDDSLVSRCWAHIAWSMASLPTPGRCLLQHLTSSGGYLEPYHCWHFFRLLINWLQPHESISCIWLSGLFPVWQSAPFYGKRYSTQSANLTLSPSSLIDSHSKYGRLVLLATCWIMIKVKGVGNPRRLCRPILKIQGSDLTTLRTMSCYLSC